MTMSTLPKMIDMRRPRRSETGGTKGNAQIAPREYMAEMRPRIDPVGLLKTGRYIRNQLDAVVKGNLQSCQVATA